MPQKSNYEECYRILLLSPGSDWNSFRKAYKLQIKNWHPDRFPEGSAKNLAANEKIKLINIAYNELLRYYKENGQLPAIDTAPVQTPAEQVAPTASTETNRTSNNNQTFDKNPTTPEKRSGTNYRVLITIILVTSSLIFFSLVETPENNERTKDDDKRISYINNKPVTPTIQKNKFDLIEKTPLPYSDTLNNKSLSSPDRSSTKYITIGSKMSDILEIQGTPDKIVDETWFYGESEIQLIDGRVSGWKRAPGSPIKTSIMAK